jgi:hypothetical protein
LCGFPLKLRRDDEIDAIGLAPDVFVDPFELDFRQCENANSGNSIPNMSQITEFMTISASQSHYPKH